MLIIIFLFLFIIIVSQLAIARSFYLFRRAFWLDELVTYTLVSDRDIAHSLRAIAGGLDTNPPAYHLILRALRSLNGDAGIRSLRCFSFLSVMAALVGLYVHLRQVYEPLVAFAAVLAVWGHPLVLRYAFEARMYGPWLAAVVWFSYALGRSWEQAVDPWFWALLASTSLLASAMHTLGTLALALVLLPHLFAHDLSQWSWYRLGLAGFGPLAVLAWAPIVWRQNHAYATTWADAPTKRAVYGYFNTILFPGHLAVVLVGGGLASFLAGIWGRVGVPVVIPRDPSVLAGLAGLALMPLVLVALSFSVMPLMSERFALPAVASLAVATASVVSHVPGPWAAALCGLLYLIGGLNLRDLLSSYRQEEKRIGELIHAIRTHTGEEPVLFEDVYYLHFIYHYEPDIARRSFAIDYGASEIGASDAYLLAARDFSKRYSEFYSIPRTAKWAEVSGAAKLYLVLPWYIQQGFFDLERRYPGFRALPIEAGLYQLVATRHPTEAAQARRSIVGSTGRSDPPETR
jgi:hypothetical protein